MGSPGLREATQAFFQGCCSTAIPGEPESQPIISKMRTTSSACRQDFAATTASSFFPNTEFTNHESIPSLQESFTQFVETYPKYLETSRVDQIRAQHYYHLSHSNHVCLDYIGIGLFSQSQVNSPPHVQNSDFPFFGVSFKPSDLKSQLLRGGEGSELETAIRKRIMEFLNISENDYCMVFTANRSSAFKLVAESYPFKLSRKLLTVYDHESEALDAMIDASEKRGARVTSAEFKWPRLRVHSAKLRKMIVRKNKKKKKHRGLFVFPLQSRMSGASYSYQWMTLAQEHGWHVLFDACALGPKDMDSFGLSLFRPDFLVCSFYKVFGENPTGFGCLFFKKSIVPILEDSSGSGIVSITPVKNLLEDSPSADTELEKISKLVIKQETEENETSEVNLKKSSPTDKRQEYSEQVELEKQIVPVSNNHESSTIECKCLDHVDSLGLMLINTRGRYFINWLVTAMMKLQHPNRLDNYPLVTIYGPNVKFDRGQALAFNIYDWKGEKVEPALVQKLADRSNISLGHGILHNIFFPETSEDEKQRIFERNAKQNETSKTKGRKGDQGLTAVTAALNFLATFEDAYRLWAFVAQFLDADFVEKERWRYTSLNQKTIEV